MKLAGLKLKASYTIEAALLMPCVLGIIVFIIYLSFYCFDYAYLSQCAYSSALRGAHITLESANDAASEATKNSNKLSGSGVLARGSLAHDVSADGDSVTVSYKLSLAVPLSEFLKNVTSRNNWSFEIRQSAGRLKPAFYIRQCKKLK